MKKILVFLILALGLSLFQFPRLFVDQNVHIYFCDVGQGDGILIVHGFFQMIIDGGPDDKMSDCLKHFLPLTDKTLEVVLATHGDSDHITGLIKILQNYQAKTILTQAYGKKTATWEKFRVEVKKHFQNGAQLIQPTAGKKIVFDDLLSTLILNPFAPKGQMSMFTQDFSETQLSAIYDQEEKEYNTTNNEAIALFLTIKNLKIAFTADIEEPIELALTTTHLLEDIDILKVGHHGSKTSNSMAFLETLRPEAAVISVGRNNRYGHPSPEVMKLFGQKGIKILRTDQHGTVELITNGTQYWWKTHPNK